MFQRFAACQARRPVATCLVTGASVMSIGDSAVQLCGSGTLDLERNVVVSAYNGGSKVYPWKLKQSQIFSTCLL